MTSIFWIFLWFSRSLTPSSTAHSPRSNHCLYMAMKSHVETVEDDLPLPPRKRTRVNSTREQRPSTPRLFAPFRALGLITNHVPFVLQTRSQKGVAEGPRLHILTCLGKSWALWEGGKMTLLFVGKWVSTFENFSHLLTRSTQALIFLKRSALWRWIETLFG